MVEDFLETDEGKKVFPTWVEMTTMGAVADPTDVQGAAVFLGPAALGFMTSTDIVIDGGFFSF